MFYTVQELAELLKVSHKTIRKPIKSHKLEAVKVEGRIRISREAFEDYLQRNLAGRPGTSTKAAKKTRAAARPVQQFKFVRPRTPQAAA
jgi:excisionase family DNA binding protein